MSASTLSRREFLKLASLSLLSAAASPALPLLGPDWPTDCGVTNSEVLSAAQRMRLLKASQTFIAPDIESARQVALDIDFIEGRNEDASTMCGPLAIAILQSAELLGAWARPHDFWLLNPRVNRLILENTFPVKEYHWHQFNSSIGQFDFSAFPLMTGDLVYLHAGAGDTFEHVLVVNRVDSDQRAYSVSNFFTATGTIIEERLLYDPAQPGVGQFNAFNDRGIRNTLGNTGSGGFRVWRARNGRDLEFPSDAPSRELRSGLDQLLLSSPAQWFGVIKKAGGPKLYHFNPYEAFHPASTIQLPIALAFYSWLETKFPADWASYITEYGVQGRTYAQLLEAMIVNSEEQATQALNDWLGKDYLAETWRAWDLQATQAEPRRSNATELATAFEKLHVGRWISTAGRAHLLELMATHTVNDDTGLGQLRQGLPSGTVVYSKPGSLVDWPRVVGDSGLIQLPGSSAAYIFSLHGVGKDAAGYEELEATLDEAITLFGDYLLAVA